MFQMRRLGHNRIVIVLAVALFLFLHLVALHGHLELGTAGECLIVLGSLIGLLLIGVLGMARTPFAPVCPSVMAAAGHKEVRRLLPYELGTVMRH